MLSGVGTLVSGAGPLGLTQYRPTRIPSDPNYDYTQVENIPSLARTDGDGIFRFNSKEEKAQAQIIENQLIGASRAHSRLSYVIYNGVWRDISTANYLNVMMANPEAVINGIYVGGDPQATYSWIDLDKTTTNYLWMSLVERASTDPFYRSSLVGRDWIPQQTTTPSPPSSPNGFDVLLATYNSGFGINLAPPEKNAFDTVANHVYHNRNPHGVLWNQSEIVLSGVDILNQSVWNSAANSGAPVIYYFSNLTYMNNVTELINSNILVSGLTVNISSGSLDGTFLSTLSNWNVQNFTAGNMLVTSGFTLSGSLFRQNITISSGVTVDGVDFTTLVPHESGALWSGNMSGTHTHSFLDIGYKRNSIYPRYPGAVTHAQILTPAKLVNSRIWSYTSELENSNTLRHNNDGNSHSIYFRQYCPEGYNQLDSVRVHHQNINGSVMTSTIVDAFDTTYTPTAGNSLSIVSGTSDVYMVVSGFSQANIGPQVPIDLGINFGATSGTAQLLGEMQFVWSIANSVIQ